MTLPPRRLLDSTPEASEEARLLVDHLQAVPAPAPLSEAAVERISRRLEAIPVASAPGFRKLWWGLVIGASLALAAVWSWNDRSPIAERRRIEPATVADSAPASSVASEPVEAADPTAASSSDPAAASEPAPASSVVSPPTSRGSGTGSSVTAVPSPSKRKQRISIPRPAPPVVARAEPVVVPEEELPPEPDPLLEESRLLQSALHHLRNLKDGEAALAVLDQYEQRFPQGQLRAEATLARVDSLLLLARPEEALARLQRLSAVDRSRLPRSRELRVLEVELLAEVGRCDQALLQLERLPSGEPPLDERALFVHATCEARAQRHDRARSLYEELLRRWPDGAHAAQARRALGKSP